MTMKVNLCTWIVQCYEWPVILEIEIDSMGLQTTSVGLLHLP